MDDMNRNIENICCSVPQLGSGIINPIAYDTAIVACIPNYEDMNKPEFPESLQWIRDHQLVDGSWGSDKIFYIYGNILSTLTAIIALKRWDKREGNKELIRRGERALEVLAHKSHSEMHESIGFEILMPMLLKKAKQYNLNIAYEKLENIVSKKLFSQKFQSIKSYQQKYGFERKHTFWFSLEMIGGLSDKIDLNLFCLSDKLLEVNGSVSGSPSATAFYLTQMRENERIDIPIAYEYLKTIVNTNNGGVPPLSPNDTFELSFSLQALIMAGFPPQHHIMQTAINRLLRLWLQFDGYVGCSSYLPPDIDAISAFVYVLNSLNLLLDSNSIEKFCKFFNGKYFYCFIGESNPSISVNINALIALKTIVNNEITKEMMSKTVEWLKSQRKYGKYLFDDKWHISPYYSLSRAVFAFKDLNDELAQECIDQILSYQNIDYGWGLYESTLEETAYVTLALCYWFSNKPNHQNINSLLILENIDKFFQQFNDKSCVDLWIAKTLYCPQHVVNTFINAAKFSLYKTKEIIKL